MNVDFDAIVVGASIAGASAAGLLARRGFRVLLVDSDEFPRHKVCGEGLMPAGSSLLKRLGIAGASLSSSASFAGIRFSLQNGEALDLDFAELDPSMQEAGRVVSRRDFDFAILQWASACGNLTLRTGHRISSFERSHRGVRIECASGDSWSGRVLLAAVGVQSSLLQAMGVRRLQVQPSRFALQGRVKLRGAPLHQVEVCCSDIGEAYLAPVDGSAVRMTLLLFSDRFPPRGGVASTFESAILGFPQLKSRLTHWEGSEGIRSWAPLGLSVSQTHGDRFLLLGDCAGAVDPITGQGMTVALRDASNANRIVAEGLMQDRLSAPDLEEYSLERSRYFKPADEAARLLLYVLHRPFLARRAFRLLKRNRRLKRKILTIALQAPADNPLSQLDRLRLLAGI